MDNEVVQLIPLEKIEPHPENRRVGGFPAAKIQELAESIKAKGIINPPIIRPVNEHFQMVAGERRWRAAKLAGLASIPCIVREMDDRAAVEVMTIENLQREDVHPLDEADGYFRLQKAGMDIEDIATKVGKSTSYIYQRLKLLELEKDSRKAFIDGKLSAGHAILIARLPHDYQRAVLKEIRERYRGDVSVRDLEEIIQREIFHELGHAPFKKDDAGLLAKAGACTTCPKRTGAQKDGADVCKKDSCMDPGCYEAKIKAHVEREKTAPDGKKRLLVSRDWRNNPPEGVLRDGQWEECKKGDKGAEQVLIIAGHEAGKVTWGKKYSPGAQRTRHEPSAAEKAAEEKRKKAKAARIDYRKNLWDAILSAISKKNAMAISGTVDLPEGILRLVVETVWARLWDNYRVLLSKVEGWEKPAKKAGSFSNGREEQGKKLIVGMKRNELVLMLMKCIMIQEREVGEYDNSEPKLLEAIACQLKIDCKKLKTAPPILKKAPASIIEVKAKSSASVKKPLLKAKAKVKIKK